MQVLLARLKQSRPMRVLLLPLWMGSQWLVVFPQTVLHP
jgi:hypothetical protein